MEHQKNICFKRIQKEFSKLKNTQIDENIFLHFPKSKNKIKVLIIGPSDTPYHNGYFFFDIFIPDTYPYAPPKFKYRTLDKEKNIRFNPNLYKNGKVCLSIINTWDGPTWSPCNTIQSVLLSIQSMVFNKNALKNEPGYEDEKQNIVDSYDEMINYATLKIAVLGMLENTPNGFCYFKKIMKTHFIKNYEWYLNECNNRRSNIIIHMNLYEMKTDIDYKTLYDKFEKMKDIVEKKHLKCVKICKNGKKCNNLKKIGEYCKRHYTIPTSLTNDVGVSS